MNWRDHPAKSCKRQDPELFFDVTLVREAKTLCSWCPVRQECLDAAQVEDAGKGKFHRYGVRGGLSGTERFELDPTAVRRCEECGNAMTTPHHNRLLCSPECSRKRRTRQSAESKVRVVKHITDNDPRHGTLAGYQAHSWAHQRACDPCRAAQSAYMKAWRVEQKVSA